MSALQSLKKFLVTGFLTVICNAAGSHCFDADSGVRTLCSQPGNPASCSSTPDYQPQKPVIVDNTVASTEEKPRNIFYL